MSVATIEKPESLVSSDSKFKVRSTSVKKFRKEELLDVFRMMVLSRSLDNKMLNLLKQGKGFFHVGSSGHEAVQLAASKNMISGKDWSLPYYRDMTFAIGMGITPRQLLSAHLSRVTDPSHGKQMPSHFNSREKRIISVSSSIGSHLLPGLGVAQAATLREVDEIVYISCGDGATSEGSFFELLNWAGRTNAPAVILVQDNGYAISVPVRDQTSHGSISKTAVGFENLKIFEVDGTDFFNSHAALEKAVRRARRGEGPSLVHAHTVRLLAHSSSDDQYKYRPYGELEKEQLYDPVDRMAQRLINAGIATADELEAVRLEVKHLINAETLWAAEQDHPKPEDALTYVYSDGQPDLKYEAREPAGDTIVMVDAINHALHEEMEWNDDIVVFGEDVAGPKGGVFTATKGLTEKFGEKRCYNSPLAEASILGTACGLAIRGYRPVVEIQFGDYIWPAMQQLRNQISTLRYRSHNEFSCPMVIRVPVGGYIHGGLCHSQNIESLFAHIPGFKIALPSTAADAKGLLKTAIRMDDPVLFLEHKGLYRQGFARTPEPDPDYYLPFGKARTASEGNDLTIVTYGLMVHKALNAAKKYAKKGVTLEVIDLRTIVPLDWEAIIQSVKKTNRVLVLHEDIGFAGFGGEIASGIADEAFEYLDAPVMRVAAKYAPVPFAVSLEDFILPNEKDIENAIERLIRY